MTNQERAERIILGRTATDAVQELHKAGLIMPDLPDVENSGSVVAGGGVGARFPKTAHSIPHVVIFGNPQITPHIQAVSCDDNLVAIRADQIDHMIASLITARNLMYKKEDQ